MRRRKKKRRRYKCRERKGERNMKRGKTKPEEGGNRETGEQSKEIIQRGDKYWRKEEVLEM